MSNGSAKTDGGKEQMKVIEKNEGAKIPYEVKGTKIVFNDDELTGQYFCRR